MKRGFLNSNKAQSALLSLTPAAKPKFDADGLSEPVFGVVQNPGFPNKNTPYKIIYETIPPVPLNRNYVDYPDGWTECAISPLVKDLIVTHPGFPARLPRPILPLPYEIRAAPGMGLGLYATRELRSGELIIAERPLVLTSSMLGLKSGKGFDPATTTFEQLKRQLLTEWEREVRGAFERMLPEDQTAFMALANTFLDDDGRPLVGIIRTNGFGIDCYKLPEERLKGGLFGRYTVVTRTLSRANHSCEPNMRLNFEPMSLAMCAWAFRDIRKGEALTVAYTNKLPYAERQEALMPYGFVCECPKCLRERPSKS